jgi:GNAT superfamily N-acetyltransferase
MADDVTITRYLNVPRSAELAGALDAIFFEASNTQSFADEAARTAFRERWLGRYLQHDPEFAYLAFAASSRLAGYLVGSINDPAENSRFADVGYFADFRELTKRYPAHLHVNLVPAFRNFGVGGRLIETFVADAKHARVPGVHVVTSASAANVRFYNRNGFREAARIGADHALVFLARAIA